MGIKTYEDNGGFCVSVNGSWVPGIYDTRAAAERATQWSDAELEAGLASIYRFDGQDRPVTMADLDQLAPPS